LLAEHPAGAGPNAPQKEYGYSGGRSIITAQGGGVVTLNPSANQSPDPGQVGTLAVTDISNSGHGSTLTVVNAFDIQSQPPKNNTQQRSAIWSSFQTGPAGVVSLKLKFDWTASGNVNASVEVGGSASARIDFGISYSLDGGSSWTNALSRFRQVSQSGEGSQGDGISEGGSVEVILSPSQNISLVQVRDFMKANATANAPNKVSGAIAESGAGITTSVSNIRLEVDTAPVISNVAAGGITASNATITWNTNENSDSQVEYGTTTAYGQSTTLDPAILTAHSEGLSGLAAGTLYHYRVKSRDATGNLAVSGDFSFTTAPDTTPPTVASFSPAAGATNVNANANVIVTFSEAMTAATVNGATVELRDPSNALVSATVSYNAASLTTTLDPITSLSAGVTYTARVKGDGTDPRVKDVAGNALAADVTWTFTTAQNGSGGIKWLVTDHLGSTRMVIDETGSLGGIQRHDFAPFGEELSAGMGIRSAALGYGDDSTRQKFTGKERDDETGLDFYEARYYESLQGRFTSTDPIILSPERVIDPQQINLYHYARNNPLRFTDPTGEKIEENIPEEYKERYDAWKKEYLSTEAGRKQWAKYADDKNFTLTITVADRGKRQGGVDPNQGAETGNYEWNSEGGLKAATITLGNNINSGYPNPANYPVTSSLQNPDKGYDVSGKVLAATKIAHEFGHVNRTASTDAKLYQLQQQLIPEYRELFFQNRNDPRLAGMARQMGGTPAEISVAREHWAEANTIPYLRDRYPGGKGMPGRIKKAIEAYQKTYPGR
jgi:RHS repeat-associated protein